MENLNFTTFITAMVILGIQTLLGWLVWSFKKAHPSHEDLAKTQKLCEQKTEDLEKELKEHVKEYQLLEKNVHGIAVRMESMPTGKDVSSLLKMVTEAIVKIDIYIGQNEKLSAKFEKHIANNHVALEGK